MFKGACIMTIKSLFGEIAVRELELLVAWRLVLTQAVLQDVASHPLDIISYSKEDNRSADSPSSAQTVLIVILRVKYEDATMYRSGLVLMSGLSGHHCRMEILTVTAMW